MAWNASEEGNPAWLTKQASEHGGVNNFINNIHNEGYREGHERGMFDGAGFIAAVAVASLGAYKGIKYLIQKRKAKKQAVEERSEAAQEAIRQICNDYDSEQYDESEKPEIDKE